MGEKYKVGNVKSRYLSWGVFVVMWNTHCLNLVYEADSRSDNTGQFYSGDVGTLLSTSLILDLQRMKVRID